MIKHIITYIMLREDIQSLVNKEKSKNKRTLKLLDNVNNKN